MPHTWIHDETAKGTYKPKVCSGVADLDPANPTHCTKCGRLAGIHNGTPFSDHSKCIMTCEVCAEVWECNKLYPQNKECSGIKNN